MYYDGSIRIHMILMGVHDAQIEDQGEAYRAGDHRLSLVGVEANTGGVGGVGGLSPNVDEGTGDQGLTGANGLIYVD